jgi:hypothetical protein
MDNRNKSTPNEQDVLIGKIKLLAGKTETDPNPEELESLRKLIKKNVPWRLRGYFMAYLLRELNKSDRKGTPQNQRSLKNKKPARKGNLDNSTAPNTPATPGPKKAKPAKVLPEGSKTLYLNVGKMKKLYTKELSLLLQEKLNITRSDIYSIKVHDKYSFITMNEENCEKAIETLNGLDIKGRTATVTYSKKK